VSGHRYKPRGRVGFFDQERRSRKISKLGNPLERLDKVIDFEIFREELEINMLNANRKNNSGCKPYDIEEKLFDKFHDYLDSIGILVNVGKVVDVTIVEVPCQRNRSEENEKIKSGGRAELWKEEPAKKRQKDRDARWTRKRGKRYFGYKDHVK
jgi:hypothetical protein